MIGSISQGCVNPNGNAVDDDRDRDRVGTAFAGHGVGQHDNINFNSKCKNISERNSNRGARVVSNPHIGFCSVEEGGIAGSYFHGNQCDLFDIHDPG